MVISTDGVNHFIGNDFYIQSTLSIAQNDLSQLLTNALGSASRFSISTATSSYLVDWRPNLNEEVYTNNVSSNTNPLPRNGVTPVGSARFSHSYGFATSLNQSIYNLSAIMTSSTTATSNSLKIAGESMNNADIQTPVDDTYLCWITADNQSIASFTYNSSNNYSAFIWTGVLKEFPAVQGVFPRNCAAIAIINDADGSTISDIYRVGLENSQTKKPVLTSGDANYALACSDSQTPGSDLWTSDLYLVDDDSANNNPGTGRCSNLAIAKGGSFVIGDMYDLATAHKDGGSSNFLCVANFGTDKILMRMTDQI